MIEIDNTIISLDLFEDYFVCNLDACKGICCIEGDAGAPLTKEEIIRLNDILPHLWDRLSMASKKIIKKQGIYYIDEDGDPVTSIVNGRECVFTYMDKNGCCKCAIEQAYKEGKVDFYKPISCHLYPVRLQEMKEYTAINVHRWKVCKPARLLGNKLSVPTFKFLKEPLIRRFGTDWYEKIEIFYKEYYLEKLT